MKASLAVCIFAALLAVGACLQCQVCNGTGNSCTGDLQTCAPGEDTCGIALTETTLEGQKSQTILKGCAASSLCKAGPVSVNFGKGMATRTIFTCCTADACRTIHVTVPPADTKPNGRRCPGCYAVLTSQCTGETTECTGAETQCIHIDESVTSGGQTTPVVMKGCASESFCAQTKVGKRTFAGITGDLTQVKCTVASGAGGVAPGSARLLLPALAGLLLLKLLS